MRATADRADDLGFGLLALGRAYQCAVAEVLDGIPHGPRGYHTLGAVARAEHASQLALATRLGIDRTVMTYLIDDLAAAGLVERQLNPADRRQRKIVLTELGRRTVAAVARRVRQAEDEVLGALADADRETFRELLWRAVDGLGAGASGGPCDPAEGRCDPPGDRG
jgi:DNA-binding MarR family transcriptional regulator